MNAQVNSSILEEQAWSQTEQKIEAFLRWFRPAGLQNICAIPPDGGGPVGKTFAMPADAAAAAAWAIQYNQLGYGVYFTVNPVSGRVDKKPTKADIAAIEYAHADLDPDKDVMASHGYAAARKHLLEVQLPEIRKSTAPPTFVIDSGNGLGLFWKHKQALSIEAGEELNLRAVELYGSDKGTHNADRLMRLPHTLNYSSKGKIDKGYPSRTSSSLISSGGISYTHEQLASAWPAVDKAAATPAVQAAGAGPQWAPEPLCDMRLADIKSALVAIGEDDGYNDWINIGMALRQEAGNEQDSQVLFDVWDEWSSQSPVYPGLAELKYKWSTFTRKAGGVTIGTVFDRAKKLAWKAPSDIAYEKLIAGLHATPTAVGTGPQCKPMTDMSWVNSFTITEEEAAMFDDPEWMYENLIIQGHVVIICARPGAGKTTIMMHIAGDLASRFNVYYVNADVSGGDAKSMVAEAKEKGYTLLLPDMRVGESMATVVEKLRELNDSGVDLSGMVWVFDTLKKMTDVINKSSAKELLSLMRSLSAKGMTIILLAHTNKYADSDDRPIFEGTGDIRSDTDELIYLIPGVKDDTGTMKVSTDVGDYVGGSGSPTAKTRGKFVPITFEIDVNRNVRRLDGYSDTLKESVQQRQAEKDKDIIDTIEGVLRGGRMIQADIYKQCKSVHDINRRPAERVLKAYIGDRWNEVVVPENNAHYYELKVQDVSLLPACCQ